MDDSEEVLLSRIPAPLLRWAPPPRRVRYLLLTLARLRLGDAHLTPAEQGWVHLDELARMLRADRRTVNVHVGRLRQQLAQEGIDDALDLVERRAGTGQLRIGVAELVVERLA